MVIWIERTYHRGVVNAASAREAHSAPQASSVPSLCSSDSSSSEADVGCHQAVMVRSRKARILLVLVGLAVVMVGWFSWSLEQEYGSGTNFGLEIKPDDTVVVYDVDEQAGTRSPVFEGSSQDAEAYMERRRAEGESFVIPGLVVALGVVLVVVGLLPFQRMRGGS